MGGNALKHTITERKTTEQFNRIASELIPILQKELNTEIYLVKCFHEKETHGDMDILILVNQQLQYIDFRKFVRKIFKPNEIFYNGGVTSFDYNKFQIDLIPIREGIWEAAKTYFDYDPSGNIMGKVANSIKFRYESIKGRLSYGFNGLSAVIYTQDSDKKLGEYLLTKENYKIFHFLGYDYRRFLKGFDTKEEIFDYTISTKYFQRHRFLIENLSHKDRKRNRKRKTYHEFLNYVDKSNVPDNRCAEFPDDKMFEYICGYFSNVNLKEKIGQRIKKEKISRELNSKFNGHIIMEHFPELYGKELGNLIRLFKQSFNNDYILTHTREEILESFEQFYKSEQNG